MRTKQQDQIILFPFVRFCDRQKGDKEPSRSGVDKPSRRVAVTVFVERQNAREES